MATSSDQATIWRWREHFQHDFAARMDWTIAAYENANHPPTVVVNESQGIEPLRLTLREDDTLLLDASESTDPDDDDLTVSFIPYAEAGFNGEVPPPVLSVSSEGGGVVRVKVTARCAESWIDWRECPDQNDGHIIIAVTDDGEPSLTRYRRVIITAVSAE